MRKYFAIALLFGVVVGNVDIICQSLCLSGDKNTADMHASHKAAKHDMPKSAMCPIIHSAEHSSHHNTPKTFIKCCPDTVSLKYELTLSKPVKDLIPYPHIISKAYPQEKIFLNYEQAPLENPPQIPS
jgi:hypothetical protein